MRALTPADHQLDPSDVLAALGAIIKSRTFTNNERLSEFLKFVVLNTLDGDLHRLKESVIGAEVYRRAAGYSPKADPIVRTEARRLRKKLADYYEVEGSLAKVLILLPVGGYVAQFERRAETVNGSGGTENFTVVDESTKFKRPEEVEYSPFVPKGPARRSFPLWLYGTAACLLLIATAFAIRYSSVRRARSVVAPESTSIFVGSIQNKTGQSDRDYVAEGLADGIVTDLIATTQIPIISSLRLANGQKSARSAAEPALRGLASDSRADLELAGSLRRNSSAYRLSLRISEVRTSRYIWAKDYDCADSDLTSLPRRVSLDIAEQLNSPRENQNARALAQTANPVAYDFYLRGKFYDAKRTPAGALKAIHNYEQAIRSDPKYASAYAGLASTYIQMSSFGLMSARERSAKALEIARRAVELDDHHAGAHLVLALALHAGSMNWSGAEREYRRALELDEREPRAHELYANLLSELGRHEEAIAQGRRALALDPISGLPNSRLGTLFYYARNYDESIRQSDRALELRVKYPPAVLRLAAAYGMKGQLEKALETLEEWLSPDVATPYFLGLDAHFLALQGKRTKAEEILQRLQASSGTEWVGPTDIALVLVALRRNEEALDKIDEGYRQHDDGLAALKVEPMFDPLRKSPRFTAILDKLGFSGS